MALMTLRIDALKKKIIKLGFRSILLNVFEILPKKNKNFVANLTLLVEF